MAREVRAALVEAVMEEVPAPMAATETTGTVVLEATAATEEMVSAVASGAPRPRRWSSSPGWE